MRPQVLQPPSSPGLPTEFQRDPAEPGPACRGRLWGCGAAPTPESAPEGRGQQFRSIPGYPAEASRGIQQHPRAALSIPRTFQSIPGYPTASVGYPAASQGLLGHSAASQSIPLQPWRILHQDSGRILHQDSGRNSSPAIGGNRQNRSFQGKSLGARTLPALIPGI